MMKFVESLMAGIGAMVFYFSVLKTFLPDEFQEKIKRFLEKVFRIFMNPKVEITFEEFPLEGCSSTRSKAYSVIQAYLGTNLSGNADRLKANVEGHTRSVSLSMDDYEEVNEVYKGAMVSWLRRTSYPRSNIITFKEDNSGEKRAYVLSFPRKDRDLIVRSYLTHVLNEGRTIIELDTRQRLYTNSVEEWSSVGFDHPATFDTLAMEPMRKKEIMDDLIAYTKARDFYQRVGKPWRRGYLLYGPPGTGKSTLIAAMANFLHYHVYDLDLTSVKDNTQLRKIMLLISKRAIVVIEDIDCSLHITGKRKNKKKPGESLFKKAENSDGNDIDDSKVTLSGLLNFMDGLGSAARSGERIFVFTTNHVQNLDEALIRRGRMDKHIEMSYCCFEAFKVLAKNYLNLDSHDKFEEIRCFLSETQISTADVAENLLPTSADQSCADECLERLIAALQLQKKVKEEKRIEEEEVLVKEEEVKAGEKEE